MLARWLQNYRWDGMTVKPYIFYSTFEIQLNEILPLTAEVAELIRQYGVCALASLEACLTLHPGEVASHFPDARMIVQTLLTHHTTIIRYLCDDIKTPGSRSGDAVSGDLITCLVQYENMVWILRMCLETKAVVSE